MLLKIQKILKCTRCYISVYTLIMSVLIYLPILKIVTYLTPFFSEYLSSEEGVVGIFKSAITLCELFIFTGTIYSEWSYTMVIYHMN